jgi:hypothetical protein
VGESEAEAARRAEAADQRRAEADQRRAAADQRLSRDGCSSPASRGGAASGRRAGGGRDAGMRPRCGNARATGSPRRLVVGLGRIPET